MHGVSLFNLFVPYLVLDIFVAGRTYERIAQKEHVLKNNK